MRIVFIAILILHGLIHLLGFVKAFDLAPVEQLTTPISRAAGLAWLIACLAALLTALLFALRVDAWWMIGAATLVLSQALVVSAWSDAKAGTLANLVLLVGVVLGFGLARFSSETDRQVHALLATAPQATGEVLAQDTLDGLPPATRRWLERSGAIGRPRPRVVRLRQLGEMQLEPDAGFRSVVAHQTFRVDEPAFLWSVRLAMFGLPIVGRDTYLDGHGRMRIEAGGLLPIVDEADEKIDQGAMLRYLGETVWFPAGALSRYVRWKPGPDPTREARATMRHGAHEVSGDFTFDDEGRFVSLRAERYRGGGAEASLTPWSVRATAWEVFDGVEIPSAGEVVWHLPEGDFVFYRWRVDQLELDPR